MSLKYEKIYQDILSDIRNGVLKENDKVATEHQIMNKYKVSRITAQKSLNKLASNGYVERKPGRGTFVKFNSSFPDYNENIFKSSFVSVIMANQMQSLFFLRGIEQHLSSENIHTSISLSDNDPHLELEAVKKAISSNSRGIIFYPSEPFVNDEIFRNLIRDGYPLVFLDRAPIDLPCNIITTDGFTGGYLATKHLLEHGHKKIAIINSGLNLFETVKHRYEGYRCALRDYGIDVNPSYVLECYGMNKNCGRELLTSPDPPTAIFCTNDSVAFNIYDTAYDLGMVIPDELSIVGFDNLSAASQIIPALTTIEQPFLRMGIEAAKAVLNHSKSTAYSRMYLPVNLIIRSSVKYCR
ncbi:MAG: GntR family transcriptional regulator [Oscillospiraceae bacterium]|nr:GntR family transcriptional regulator [Oscillospiraceae bacterium]MDD4413530.1 GntR family transcriptional regulator [Oscillospiraceae bacterium]